MSQPTRFNVFAAAQSEPRALALVGEAGGLSYEALAALASRASAWLCSEGLARTRAEPVAVLAHPTAAQVALCHALWALGIPLLPVHPALTPDERKRLLERAGARVLVEERWLERAPDRAPAPALDDLSDDETLMALLETSGSSGAPRLCRLSRRAFLASARASAERLGWMPEERWLLCLPFAHVGGLSVLTRCLERRACVVADPGRVGVRPLDALVAALAQHRPTLLSLVPTQLVRLLQRSDFELPDSVRVILVGGAELDSHCVERAQRRGWPIALTYGLTEACSQVATQKPGDAPRGVGTPLEGVELRIERGQIEIRGETLFSGYLGGPARSPVDWFATGDLGHLDASGCLHVLGRASERIVTGGENVDPIEVERALAVSLGRRICVAGRAHAEWGEQVVVFVEGKPDDDVVRDLVQGARERLAPFKRPRLYGFVPEFPVGASGKIKRQELAASGVALRVLSYSSGNPPDSP